MARDLDTDLQTLRTIVEYAQNRDFKRASSLAEEILAGGFEHPLLLNIVATRLEQDDRYEESLRLLRRAVTIAPGDVGARNALSLCLQRLGRPAEALPHVDELLKRHPDLAFAHANKGNALIALGELSRAKQSHQRALELEPGNLAACAALASIATHRGEHQEARHFAQQALKLAPGFPDAVMSLAAAELAGGATDSAQALLHPLILDPRAGPTDRARATGLLGDALDAAGRYAEAFDNYATCNDALRRIHRQYSSGTDMLSYTHALSAALPANPVRSASAIMASEAAPNGPREHVFLLGFPRSGTTLLEVILDGHPNVASLEEHELLTDAVMRFMREPVDLQPLAEAGADELQALRAAYWMGVAAAGIEVGGKVFIDKHPLHTLKLPLIARLFPDAKILFACRDPRDVVLSCFRRRFKMNPAMYQLLTLPGAAALYDAVMAFAEKVRPSLALAWHTVRYESLVADLGHEAREICGFLGLEWREDMADFAQRVQGRDHATPSTAQLARGLDHAGIGHWRHYQAQLQPVMAVLQPWVNRFSYPP